MLNDFYQYRTSAVEEGRKEAVKAFLPHLIASGDGHVVNVSSVFGLFSVQRCRYCVML